MLAAPLAAAAIQGKIIPGWDARVSDAIPQWRDDPLFPIRYTLATEQGKNRLLFSNPASEKGRVNGTVRLSYDEGQTWPVGKSVEPGWAAYSDLAVTKDGKKLYDKQQYGDAAARI